MTRRPCRLTQAEIARARRAAGPDRIVEILPSGTIRLVPDDGKRAPIHDMASAKDASEVVEERLR